ncbi:MAG: AAA family ATPase [Promethearchaeia archaeon]
MIESIRLKNFRKHEDLKLEFDPQFNLLHGRNNAGKTTVFYAIEYCLFGSVGGFRKLAQLAKFKQNALGVEMILKGKNGTTYKLQRLHRLKGKKRSAHGFFTLKKLTKNDGEKYVLASDFGDHEEDLSLKLLEILGISKRFFETGLHFAQGEISEIIRGDKELDIVFGIKTATALSKIFGRRALDFEKEARVLGTFEKIIEEAKNEKKEYQAKLKKKEEKHNNLKSEIEGEKNTLNQLQHFKGSSKTISKEVKSVEKAKKEIEEVKIKVDMIQQEMDENKKKFGPLEKLEEEFNNLKASKKKLDEKVKEEENNIRKIQNEIKKHENKKVELTTIKKQKDKISKELQAFINKHGTKEDLENRLNEIKKKRTGLAKKIKETEEMQVELEKLFRTVERKKGDVEGILARRRANENNQKCEYCGAPIDQDKIQTEIKECKSKLEEFEQDLRTNEEKRDTLKENLLNLQEKEKENYQERIRINNLIKKIEDFEKKIAETFQKDLENELTSLENAIETNKGELKKREKELNATREEQKKLEQQSNEIKNNLKRNEELKEKLVQNQEEKQKAEQFLSEKKEQFLSILNKIKKDITKYITKLDKKDPFLGELEKTNESIEAFENTKSFEAAVKLKEEFNELIITKISEKTSTLKHLKEQSSQLEKDLVDNRNQIKRLDKKIAANEKKVEILHIKEELAEKYRKYQDIFKETQQIIRNNVSSALEEKVLKYHNILSTEEEFEKVYIDNEDYSVSITPKGMEKDKDIYPAWVYEGGGYKLILGLAYKFSLSELLGKSSFLLIDEPTEFIDVNNRQNLLSNLSSIAEDTQVILITHQDVDKIVCDNKIKLKR